MSISEMLPDGENYVNENGDIKHIDPSMGEMPIPEISGLVNKYLRPSAETIKTKEADSNFGVSIKLTERAIHLSGALDEYLKASRVNGFTRAMDHYTDLQSRYRPEDAATISGSESRSRSKGDVEFLKGFGSRVLTSRALTEAGYDIEEVKLAPQEEADKFVDRYTGPANKKNRAKFRKNLKWQIK